MSAASTENIQRCLDILDEINSEASIVFNKETYNALVEAEKELAALVAIANTSTNSKSAPCCACGKKSYRKINICLDCWGKALL